jgi:hypothetical protein
MSTVPPVETEEEGNDDAEVEGNSEDEATSRNENAATIPIPFLTGIRASAIGLLRASL